jgi:uncharacterized protein (DUF1501 family)
MSGRTITRRGFLLHASAAAATAAMPAPARAAARPRHLVLLRLRGGLDGLAAAPPIGDASYRDARGLLALAPPGTEGGMLDLDGRTGLHPSLSTLHRLYRTGQMRLLLGSGPHHTASHAQARRALGAALADAAARQPGALTLAFPPGPGEEASEMARELALRDCELGLRCLGLGGGREELEAALAAAERSRRARVRGDAMRLSAVLSEATRPVIALLDLTGFDTHGSQGGAHGRLATALGDLDEAVALIASRSGKAWDATAVVAATEFGRSITVNRTGGTEHGLASVTVLAGGRIAGGTVEGTWPPLGGTRILSSARDPAAIISALAADAAS